MMYMFRSQYMQAVTQVKKLTAISAYLLRHVGHASITKLMKLLYLADLEAASLGARPITGIRYVFGSHGPFSPVIYTTVAELEQGQLAGEREEGAEFQVLQCTEEQPIAELPLTEGERWVLDRIIQRFGSLTWKQLKPVIYGTKPMLEAQHRGRGSAISFDSVRPQQMKARTAYDLNRLAAGSQAADAEQTVSAGDFRLALHRKVRCTTSR